MKNTIRRFLLPLLKQFAFDFSYSHPWVKGTKIFMNSFTHKGYWFYGKNRELQSMVLFSQLISPGMLVIEVGGHIGFISNFFSHLVGAKGRVIVFEPGGNNLPYTRKNLQTLTNVTLEEKGVGNFDGHMDFFEDSLTGQNNSFVENFSGLESNKQIAYVDVSVARRKVEIVKLDTYLSNQVPGFIKIDVEGFEYEVLLGASSILKHHPILMVEIQAKQDEIYHLLSSLGFRFFDEMKQEITSVGGMQVNVFCLHKETHSNLINTILG
jgi:FkbM family methyltransferase